MNLTAEVALVNKLVSLELLAQGFGVNMGFSERKERVRGAIKRFVADVTYAIRDGKRVTLQQQFEAVYGEKL